MGSGISKVLQVIGVGTALIGVSYGLNKIIGLVKEKKSGTEKEGVSKTGNIDDIFATGSLFDDLTTDSSEEDDIFATGSLFDGSCNNISYHSPVVKLIRTYNSGDTDYCYVSLVDSFPIAAKDMVSAIDKLQEIVRNEGYLCEAIYSYREEIVRQHEQINYIPLVDFLKDTFDISLSWYFGTTGSKPKEAIIFGEDALKPSVGFTYSEEEEDAWSVDNGDIYDEEEEGDVWNVDDRDIYDEEEEGDAWSVDDGDIYDEEEEGDAWSVDDGDIYDEEEEGDAWSVDDGDIYDEEEEGDVWNVDDRDIYDDEDDNWYDYHYPEEEVDEEDEEYEDDEVEYVGDEDEEYEEVDEEEVYEEDEEYEDENEINVSYKVIASSPVYKLRTANRDKGTETTCYFALVVNKGVIQDEDAETAVEKIMTDVAQKYSDCVCTIDKTDKGVFDKDVIKLPLADVMEKGISAFSDSNTIFSANKVRIYRAVIMVGNRKRKIRACRCRFYFYFVQDNKLCDFSEDEYLNELRRLADKYYIPVGSHDYNALRITPMGKHYVDEHCVDKAYYSGVTYRPTGISVSRLLAQDLSLFDEVNIIK